MGLRRIGAAMVFAIAVGGWVASASAGERIVLTDAQMDHITAGSSIAGARATAFASTEAVSGVSVLASFSASATAVGPNGALASVQAVGFAAVTPSGAVASVEVISIAITQGLAGTAWSCGAPA